MRPFRLAAAAALAVLVAACASPVTETRPVAGDPLEGMDWRLATGPDGRALPTQGAGSALLRFEDQRFSLRGPCNTHTGGWRRAGEMLYLGGEGGAIASTKRGCPGELMQRESALLAALQQPLRLQFDGPRLAMVTQGGERWVFDSRDEAPAAGRERIVLVDGAKAPCVGVAPMQCLRVRTEPGAPWELYYGEIEGFAWQQGVEYVLRVREYTVANPPADASRRRWVLVEVLDRSKP